MLCITLSQTAAVEAQILYTADTFDKEQEHARMKLPGSSMSNTMNKGLPLECVAPVLSGAKCQLHSGSITTSVL